MGIERRSAQGAPHGNDRIEPCARALPVEFCDQFAREGGHDADTRESPLMNLMNLVPLVRADCVRNLVRSSLYLAALSAGCLGTV